MTRNSRSSPASTKKSVRPRSRETSAPAPQPARSVAPSRDAPRSPARSGRVSHALERTAHALLPAVTEICGYWRTKWLHYLESAGVTNARRAALWIGHSTLRSIVADLATGNVDAAYDDVRQGVEMLWEVGATTEDLSQMITLYEESVNAWIRQSYHGAREILRASEHFDRFFHTVFSLTFKTYSELDRSRVPRLTGLTRREEQVLIGIGKGESAKSIGRALRISPRTVEAVRSRLKTKLRAKTIPELVRYALATNLVDEEVVFPRQDKRQSAKRSE